MSLYDLQSRWDDERAHQTVVRYRIRPRGAAPGRRHGGPELVEGSNISTPGPDSAAGGRDELRRWIAPQVKADLTWLPALLVLLVALGAIIAAIAP